MLRRVGLWPCLGSAFGAAVVITAGSGVALAQTAEPDARTQALALLREAEQLASSGSAREACGKYRESASLDAQLDALLPWASCLEGEGKLASAYAAFGDAVEVARRSGDPRLTNAEQAATRLRPRVSFLTVEVPSARRVPGLSVECDGFRVGSSSWGVPLPIDPGPHVVVARAFGYRDFEVTLEVKGEAEQPYLELPQLEKAEPPAPVEPPPAVVAAAPSASPLQPSRPAAAPKRVAPRAGLGTTRSIALAAAGVSVVSLGLGFVFRAKVNSKLDERDGICPSGKNCEPGTNQRLASLTLLARENQRVEIAFFVLSGASAALATGLWFWPRAERKERGSFVAPVLAPGTAGLVWGGRL